jgi:hypothetical protein
MGKVLELVMKRRSDGRVYRFVSSRLDDGRDAYKRQDRDVWLVRRASHGWVVVDSPQGRITGRSWEVLPADQSDVSPEGVWIGHKGEKAYAYDAHYA